MAWKGREGLDLEEVAWVEDQAKDYLEEPELIRMGIVHGTIVYYYGMRLRPAGPGCQPKKGLCSIEDGYGRYHSILVYDRELTDTEVRDYELDYLDEAAKPYGWKGGE